MILTSYDSSSDEFTRTERHRQALSRLLPRVLQRLD
jgi:hypothetical protein